MVRSCLTTIIILFIILSSIFYLLSLVYGFDITENFGASDLERVRSELQKKNSINANNKDVDKKGRRKFNFRS